ncbi:short-chain dehydrogenase/reductase SDR [Histoplasma capsulatum var. duboisii H88]|uniref:Short-chain dehydrogenase/reductase SDR n=1 Tax=Ajellomyces capsulatus (strain H88) TaxID=544711 RepID=F0UTF8_AJEC8|nr:short-chain dehydrogenase/reductase SDR [Histoplasma capsulatum var. duboisii H88]QSS54778.1 short-chain dehydrogenase/reductase SDR [Histoplasma capsulatum var. duboisii H88]
MENSPVWFITGASSGFGSALAQAALRAGNRVIATARNIEKSKREIPQIEELGGKWLQLDVTASDVREKVRRIVQEYGKIDVVINSAGYALFGALDDVSESEIHQQFNTNVYGPIRVMQAVIPSMRERKSGTIVNISSVAGLDAQTACSMYAGSKFALEGISESLARDLAPFYIRVLIVEPGVFRTKFATALQTPAAGTTKAYEGTPLHDSLQRFLVLDGKQPGDPAKAIERIMEVITGTGMGEGKTGFLRLPLGLDCVQRTQQKIASLQQNFVAMQEIAASTNFK